MNLFHDFRQFYWFCNWTQYHKILITLEPVQNLFCIAHTLEFLQDDQYETQWWCSKNRQVLSHWTWMVKVWSVFWQKLDNYPCQSWERVFQHCHTWTMSAINKTLRYHRAYFLWIWALVCLHSALITNEDCI